MPGTPQLCCQHQPASCKQQTWAPRVKECPCFHLLQELTLLGVKATPGENLAPETCSGSQGWGRKRQTQRAASLLHPGTSTERFPRPSPGPAMRSEAQGRACCGLTRGCPISLTLPPDKPPRILSPAKQEPPLPIEPIPIPAGSTHRSHHDPAGNWSLTGDALALCGSAAVSHSPVWLPWGHQCGSNASQLLPLPVPGAAFTCHLWDKEEERLSTPLVDTSLACPTGGTDPAPRRFASAHSQDAAGTQPLPTTLKHTTLPHDQEGARQNTAWPGDQEGVNYPLEAACSSPRPGGDARAVKQAVMHTGPWFPFCFYTSRNEQAPPREPKQAFSN